MTKRLATSPYFSLSLGLSLAVLLVACASDQSGQRLQDNLFAYAQVIRWSDFVQAASFIHPDDRPSEQQLEFDLSRLSNVKIVGYRTLTQRPGDSLGTAIHVAEVRVVNKHTMGERTVRDVQEWRWDEEKNRWWLVSGLPKLTR